MTFELENTCGDIWRRMYADCEAARTSIEYEQYILRNDAVGLKFLRLFADKARQGVRVRLLLDRVGSRECFGTPELEDLRQAGARVDFYNPLHLGHLFYPARWFPRNHTKTLVVDGRILHLGSACLADYMESWREAHARLSDAPVAGLAADFDVEDVPAKQERSCGISYMSSQPGRRNPIYRELLARIRQAHKSVYLVTPYFLPPVMLRRALRRAAKRGLDVRLIAAEKADVPFAGMVSQTYYPRAVKAGIKVYLYSPAVLHAKYAIIDDEWAMIGSTNLDYLSLLRNREANLIVTDAGAVHQLTVRFMQDAGDSIAVTRDFWHNVPWPQKIIGVLGRAMKKVL